MLLDTQFDRLGDAVKAQVVLVQVDLGKKFAFELFELHFVDSAFEDRFLDSLADTFASLGDAAQAFSPGGGFRGYVVGDDDEHGYLARNGR